MEPNSKILDQDGLIQSIIIEFLTQALPLVNDWFIKNRTIFVEISTLDTVWTDTEKNELIQDTSGNWNSTIRRSQGRTEKVVKSKTINEPEVKTYFQQSWEGCLGSSNRVDEALEEIFN